MINAIIQSVKRICTELRPSMLDHLGLGPAIEWQSEEFQKKSGIECSVALGPEDIMSVLKWQSPCSGYFRSH